MENIALPETSTSVRDLHLLLEKLGIRSIELQIFISFKQLLFFIKKLLAWRMQLESTQAFITFDVTDLPNGIRLEQQEFFVDERSIVNESSEHDFKGKLDEMCLALGEQGLNKQQVEQCRVFLEKISEQQEGNKKKEIQGFPNATWDDVQSLLYKIVTGAYSIDKQQYEALATNDINVIGSIFQNLELSLTDKKSKETIKFLLSHLTGRGADHVKMEVKPGRPNTKMRQLLADDEKLTVSELKAFIYENKIPLKVLEKITSVDHSEELSILLQLITPDVNNQLNEKLEQRLKTILRGNLNEREKEILTSGILQFADKGDGKNFRSLLTLVLHTLRDSGHFNSLELLVGLWSQVSAATQIPLWPFLVNELLVTGRGERRELFLKATEIASQMHIDRMRKLALQLEEMDAFKEKKVALNIFNPKYVFSYKLFVFLLETSLENIVAGITFTALRDKPQDSLFEAVGPLMDISRPTHLEFFRSYLAQAHLMEPPLALKMAAGQIILEFLQNISDAEKEMPWLQKTIAATAGLYVKGLQEMLRKIVKERKMGVLPTWPKNCRIAAEATLKSLKRPSLSELL
ncbi:hypothetical protein FCL47_23785 [Desulfopila sp. IMCC35006]|uniref:hypothetical protein n=1 Tax=Desulfopila sp. IMCC35006 TaxID=2569542 RepID=UPI0010ABA8CA|nr:hypothetical protein [Desulfopila sp. IMCC35006]TKB23128.1 hypothetical protein FCL47_23785 [Desulfopila sp. IMCC35006]